MTDLEAWFCIPKKNKILMTNQDFENADSIHQLLQPNDIVMLRNKTLHLIDDVKLSLMHTINIPHELQPIAILGYIIEGIPIMQLHNSPIITLNKPHRYSH